MSFDVCDRGIEPYVVSVDVTSSMEAAPVVPGAVVIGVDRTGTLPQVDPDGFDLLLTSAEVPAAMKCWIRAIDPVVEAARLRGAVIRHGHPAVVLAQILQASAGRSAAEALLLESLAYSTLLGGREFKDWLSARSQTRSYKAEDHKRVRIERNGNVISLSLANPARRNAFDSQMRDALIEALAFAAVDPTITALELRADGPDFCSGGDLDEFGSCDDLSVAHAIRMLRSPVRLLASISVPSTAFVHGACVGAGIEIPAAAQRVVAHPDTRFWLPELAMGLIPGAGGTWTLAKRIGRHRLLHWALGGNRIDAFTALAWGLVDEVVDAATS